MFVVVFDTNVLFSALGWQGVPYHCIKLAQDGKIKHITCLEILLELEDKLLVKMNYGPNQVVQVISQILSFSELVKIDNSLRVVVDDRDDDKIIECAITGRVDFIVTGDRHLLALGTYDGIPIIRPSELMQKIIS